MTIKMNAKLLGGGFAGEDAAGRQRKTHQLPPPVCRMI
jgi:hypothetical protein